MIEGLGRIMRGVWEEGGVPDKKGFGLLLCLVEKVLDGLDSFPGNSKTEVAVAALASRVGVGHGMGEAMTLGLSFPPFTGLKAEVAGLFKKGGDSWSSLKFGIDFFMFSGSEGVFSAPSFCSIWADAEVVSGDAVSGGVETGEDGGEGGAAEGGGDVAASVGE